MLIYFLCFVTEKNLHTFVYNFFDELVNLECDFELYDDLFCGDVVLMGGMHDEGSRCVNKKLYITYKSLLLFDMY